MSAGIAGEKAKRRDPRKFQYSGTACPEFRKVTLAAQAAMQCNVCHEGKVGQAAGMNGAFTAMQSGCCRRGDGCPFAHGVFECWCHPSRYRTQVCSLHAAANGAGAL